MCSGRFVTELEQPGCKSCLLLFMRSPEISPGTTQGTLTPAPNIFHNLLDCHVGRFSRSSPISLLAPGFVAPLGWTDFNPAV